MKNVLFHILFAIIVFDNAFLTQLSKIKYVFEHFNERPQRGQQSAMAHVERSKNDEDRIPTSQDEQPAEEDLTLELHFCFHAPYRQPNMQAPVLHIEPDYHHPHFFNLPHPHLEDLFRPPKFA